MGGLIFCLFFTLHFSQCFCQISSCRTNCTTSEDCWRDALTYRSSELVQQLFSFSSLAVHVRRFQEYHSTEVTDTIGFIDAALESHLANEVVDTNLPISIFNETKQILLDLCTDITSSAVESVQNLPPLICAKTTCWAESMNLFALFIVILCIAILVFVMCIVEIFRTFRQSRTTRITPKATSHINSFSITNPSMSINSHGT